MRFSSSVHDTLTKGGLNSEQEAGSDWTSFNACKRGQTLSEDPQNCSLERRHAEMSSAMSACSTVHPLHQKRIPERLNVMLGADVVKSGISKAWMLTGSCMQAKLDEMQGGGGDMAKRLVRLEAAAAETLAVHRAMQAAHCRQVGSLIPTIHVPPIQQDLLSMRAFGPR